VGLSIGSIAEKAISTVADEVGGDFKGEFAKAAEGGKKALDDGKTSLVGGNPEVKGPKPPLLIAADWGGSEAMFCNRTSDENVYVFKDNYENGNQTGVNGTALPPGACGVGDFVLADFNGDERMILDGKNEEFIKQPNAVLGGFWNVREGSDGKAFLEAGNTAAVEELMIGTQIHGRDLYTPKTIFEMNVLMDPNKKVFIEGTPWRQLGEAPITPSK
jgi:hypothetical protein